MTIVLSEVGKRFNRDWVFRNLTYTFQKNNTYAIIGSNGSGKSTLLQALAGSLGISSGSIAWSGDNGTISADDIYAHLSLVAPYTEVIEEMTAHEFLHFHQQFKPLIPNHSIDRILKYVGLENAADKQIRYYSSGMKQRVKLAQAFFSTSPLLLLDEPCTNLDSTGVELYQALVRNLTREKTVVVSSNDLAEYSFCQHTISVMSYK